ISPQASARPWMLGGVFHHDAECFELNPVTWFTLALYGVTVRGPSSTELQIPLDRMERVRFVIDNAADYWTTVLGQLRAALTELAPTDTLPSSVPEWCLLGVCRLLYTATTGDVASKSAAGHWVADVIDGQHARTVREVARLRGEAQQPVSRD